MYSIKDAIVDGLQKAIKLQWMFMNITKKWSRLNIAVKRMCLNFFAVSELTGKGLKFDIAPCVFDVLQSGEWDEVSHVS